MRFDEIDTLPKLHVCIYIYFNIYEHNLKLHFKFKISFVDKIE